MMSPREAALSALITFRRDGAWPDLYLKSALVGFSPEDAALASAITYGVLQNMSMLDFYISSFSSVRLSKIMPQVLDAMRCGAFQIIFLDRVPNFAAVNETVAQVRKRANPRAAAFANAVLRKLASSKDSLPEPDRADILNYLSVKYSHPRLLVEKLCAVLGAEGCEALLAANNRPAPVYIRVNTLKTSVDELLSLLSQRGIAAQAVVGFPDALLLENAKAVGTELFTQGYFYVQDIASQLAVMLLAPESSETVIDMCAAPGGKSLLAAQLMQNRGKIKAFDLYPHKARLVSENAAKYDAGIIKAAAADASVFAPELADTADRIICDVPCSGIGIIRKKPDIRCKAQEFFSDLPKIQYAILENAARYLKVGGRLLYSTCTLLPEENGGVTGRFLETRGNFRRMPFEHPLTGKCAGEITLYPHLHNSDGFYITVLERLE